MRRGRFGALPIRTQNVIVNKLCADEFSPGDVAAISAADWIRFPGCGRMMIAQIAGVLEAEGLSMPGLPDYLEWEHARQHQGGEDLVDYVERWRRENQERFAP